MIILAKIVALALGIASIAMHEAAHAFAAFRLGDPTAAMQGRVSLNPLRHIDPLWTVVLPLVTYFGSRGAFIFGGAKPVPINAFNFENPRKGMMLSGLAGPAVNLLIALTCGALLRLPFLAEPVQYVLARVGLWNLVLLVFNMVPVPPLDGSRLVAWLLPRELAYRYMRLEQFGILLVVVLMMTDILDPAFSAALRAFVAVAGDSWVSVLLFN